MEHEKIKTNSFATKKRITPQLLSPQPRANELQQVKKEKKRITPQFLTLPPSANESQQVKKEKKTITPQLLSPQPSTNNSKQVKKEEKRITPQLLSPQPSTNNSKQVKKKKKRITPQLLSSIPGSADTKQGSAFSNNGSLQTRVNEQGLTEIAFPLTLRNNHDLTKLLNKIQFLKQKNEKINLKIMSEKILKYSQGDIAFVPYKFNGLNLKVQIEHIHENKTVSVYPVLNLKTSDFVYENSDQTLSKNVFIRLKNVNKLKVLQCLYYFLYSTLDGFPAAFEKLVFECSILENNTMHNAMTTFVVKKIIPTDQNYTDSDNFSCLETLDYRKIFPKPLKEHQMISENDYEDIVDKIEVKYKKIHENYIKKHKEQAKEDQFKKQKRMERKLQKENEEKLKHQKRLERQLKKEEKEKQKKQKQMERQKKKEEREKLKKQKQDELKIKREQANEKRKQKLLDKENKKNEKLLLQEKIQNVKQELEKHKNLKQIKKQLVAEKQQLQKQLKRKRSSKRNLNPPKTKKKAIFID